MHVCERVCRMMNTMSKVSSIHMRVCSLDNLEYNAQYCIQNRYVRAAPTPMTRCSFACRRVRHLQCSQCDRNGRIRLQSFSGIANNACRCLHLVSSSRRVTTNMRVSCFWTKLGVNSQKKRSKRCRCNRRRLPSSENHVRR